MFSMSIAAAYQIERISPDSMDRQLPRRALAQHAKRQEHKGAAAQQHAQEIQGQEKHQEQPVTQEGVAVAAKEADLVLFGAARALAHRLEQIDRRQHKQHGEDQAGPYLRPDGPVACLFDLEAGGVEHTAEQQQEYRNGGIAVDGAHHLSPRFNP
jgi:hypothetical protein